MNRKDSREPLQHGAEIGSTRPGSIKQVSLNSRQPRQVTLAVQQAFSPRNQVVQVSPAGNQLSQKHYPKRMKGKIPNDSSNFEYPIATDRPASNDPRLSIDFKADLTQQLSHRLQQVNRSETLEPRPNTGQPKNPVISLSQSRIPKQELMGRFFSNQNESATAQGFRQKPIVVRRQDNFLSKKRVGAQTKPVSVSAERPFAFKTFDPSQSSPKLSASHQGPLPRHFENNINQQRVFSPQNALEAGENETKTLQTASRNQPQNLRDIRKMQRVQEPLKAKPPSSKPTPQSSYFRTLDPSQHRNPINKPPSSTKLQSTIPNQSPNILAQTDGRRQEIRTSGHHLQNQRMPFESEYSRQKTNIPTAKSQSYKQIQEEIKKDIKLHTLQEPRSSSNKPKTAQVSYPDQEREQKPLSARNYPVAQSYDSSKQTKGVLKKSGSTASQSKIRDELIAVQASTPSKRLVRIEPEERFNAITKFAFATSCGMQPQNPFKVNQDAYILAPNLNGHQGFHLFGVADGHGLNGHKVSAQVKEQIPKLLSGFLKDDADFTGMRDSLEFQKRVSLYFRQSFKQIHEDLMNGQDFDSQLSGTTAVAVLFDAKRVYCANAGDSRAVLYTTGKKGFLKVTPLSEDHKPETPAEKLRCQKAGARVQPITGPGGTFLGPQRVWLPNQDLPGLAMSRSLGDGVAHSVGVSYEPEVRQIKLEPSDKFIIIASDGVWEFLSNEAIARIVWPFYLKNTPEQAGNAIVRAAAQKWRENDISIDDITVITIFLEVE